jgi:BlaI family transcriptional regulator, penicillinase repressor
MIQLTRAEEEVMQVLWKLDKAFVKEILAHFPKPRPAYNTVSTIIRILETKKVVAHESFGRAHRYYPMVSKQAYRVKSLNELKQQYFAGSATEIVSTWLQNKELSVQDIDEIKAMLTSKTKKK